MKKLQKQASSDADLKAVIHDHAQFFDKLVELIPAKFYLLVDEDSKPWFQGLSKVKRASLKQQTRQNIKKARRDRLDPDKSQTTTLDLLKKNISSNSANDDDSDDDEEEIEIKVKPVKNFETSNKSVTYEELQQRLHHKLEMLRANRGQGKRTMIMNEVRKRDNYTDKKHKREDKEDRSGDKVNVEADFEFGKVKLGDEDGNNNNNNKKAKKKKTLKVKELEKAKQVNTVVAKKHSWKAATEKAMGVKVHDDPRLLKKSLQKEKKRRGKECREVEGQAGDAGEDEGGEAGEEEREYRREGQPEESEEDC